MKLELVGNITNGSLKLFHRDYLDNWIASNKDCTVIFTIEVKKKKRSLQQNRYYFGCVVPMVQQGLNHLGNEFSLEETHEFLKARYNYKELVNEGTGEVIQVPVSTTNLSTFDFNEYKEKIQRFAAEFLNIVIPDPDMPIAIDYPPHGQSNTIIE